MPDQPAKPKQPKMPLDKALAIRAIFGGQKIEGVAKVQMWMDAVETVHYHAEKAMEVTDA